MTTKQPLTEPAQREVTVILLDGAVLHFHNVTAIRLDNADLIIETAAETTRLDRHNVYFASGADSSLPPID